jgi:hypothetical protein
MSAALCNRAAAHGPTETLPHRRVRPARTPAIPRYLQTSGHPTSKQGYCSNVAAVDHLLSVTVGAWHPLAWNPSPQQCGFVQRRAGHQ